MALHNKPDIRTICRLHKVFQKLLVFLSKLSLSLIRNLLLVQNDRVSVLLVCLFSNSNRESSTTELPFDAPPTIDLKLKLKLAVLVAWRLPQKLIRGSKFNIWAIQFKWPRIIGSLKSLLYQEE